MVKGNKILTPRKGYILESITRDFVLSKIASKLPQLQFNETCITRWDLYSADEIFIVGTNVEIQGVKRLDRFNSFSSETTCLIIEKFKELVPHYVF